MVLRPGLTESLPTRMGEVDDRVEPTVHRIRWQDRQRLVNQIGCGWWFDRLDEIEDQLQ